MAAAIRGIETTFPVSSIETVVTIATIVQMFSADVLTLQAVLRSVGGVKCELMKFGKHGVEKLRIRCQPVTKGQKLFLAHSLIANLIRLVTQVGAKYTVAATS